MNRVLLVFAVGLLTAVAVFGRDPSYAREKYLVGVRLTYKNADDFWVNFGDASLHETGTTDGTTRTSAPIYFSLEPGRNYGLSFAWSPESAYMMYSSTIRAEFFADPGTEILVNGVPFGPAQKTVEFNPADPTVEMGVWQIRLGSNLAVSPAIGQSRSLSLGDVNWASSLGLGRTGKALDPLTLAPN